MELAVLPQKDELIERCLRGDTLGYKELYGRYSKAMYNTCLRMLNNIAEAEDVLQESFIEAFKNLERFEYRTSFGGWLKQICINRSINQLNKRKIDWVDMEQITDYDSADELPIDEVDINMQVENVKKAIMKLLQNEDLCKEITRKGWEFVQKFNDEIIASKINKLYSEV